LAARLSASALIGRRAQVPFSGNSLIGLYESIAVGAYEDPPALAAQPLLSDLIKRLLDVDQTKRISVSARWRTDARAHTLARAHAHAHAHAHARTHARTRARARAPRRSAQGVPA
jgi:hypothetical protein